MKSALAGSWSRRTRVAAMALAVLALTGCAGKFDAEFVVDERQGVAVSLFVGSQGGLASEATCQELAKGLLEVATVPDTRGEYAGCSLQGRAAFVGDSASMFDEALMVTREGADYHFVLRVLSNASQAQTLRDFRVAVTMPGEIMSMGGAGELEGNTVTWSQPLDAAQPISVSSRVPQLLVPAIGLAVAAAAGVAVFAAWRRGWRIPAFGPSRTPATRVGPFCGRCGHAQQLGSVFCGACGSPNPGASRVADGPQQ